MKHPEIIIAKRDNLLLINLFTILFLLTSLLRPTITVGQSIADLAEFKGEVKGHSIYLFWEWNNSLDETEYVIEKADAAANFSEIGTTGIGHDFEDVHPYDGVNYYRLVGENSDGEKSYSDVITVEYELSNELRISPNPASNFVEVGFSLAENSSASILIMNQQGVLIEQQEVETMFESAQQLRINLQDYSPGVYLIRIDQGSSARTRKFVVL